MRAEKRRESALALVYQHWPALRDYPGRIKFVDKPPLMPFMPSLARRIWTSADDVRCFNVKDPWCTLIEDGDKPFELRTRRTHFRGPVVIVCSQTRSRTDDAKRWPQKGGPLGVARFIVDIVDCRPAKPSDAKGACCTPAAGEYVWEMRNVRKLKTHVPQPGALTFYKPGKPLLAVLRKEGWL